MSGIWQGFEHVELLPQQQLTAGREMCLIPKESNECAL